MPIELPNVTTTHPEDRLTAEERVRAVNAAVAAGRGHFTLTPGVYEELYSSIQQPPPRININDSIRHRDEQPTQASYDSTLSRPTFDYDDPSEYTRTQRTRRRPNVRAPSARTRDKPTKKCKHTGGPQYNRLRFTSSLESDG